VSKSLQPINLASVGMAQRLRDVKFSSNYQALLGPICSSENVPSTAYIEGISIKVKIRMFFLPF
jgi:hypothetical protein